MVGKLPKISEAEWLVMKTLWSHGRLTANEIVAELTEKTPWKPKTIKTLIHRLLRKGAIRFEKEGARYRYYPTVGEAECVQKERESFVRRVYGGVTNPALEDFLKHPDLSEENSADLKRILGQKGRK